MDKYSSQAQEWTSVCRDVKFLEYKPDPNISEIPVFQLYLSGMDDPNSPALIMPRDMEQLRIIDHNSYVSISAGSRNTCSIIYSFYRGQSCFKASIIQRSQYCKDSILEMLVDFKMSYAQAQATYDSALKNVTELTDAQLWEHIFAFDPNMLADINDSVRATEYALLLEAGLPNKIVAGHPVKNVFFFKNHLGKVYFWLTDDRHGRWYRYGFNQFDKSGKIILDGSILIKEEASGSDEGKAFIWQIHQNSLKS